MKSIVTVSGGTGSYTVLSGLKDVPDTSLTALVSMADDGGSTGILRKNWKVMPGGDVRQCLAALSGKEFLNYRLQSSPMKGHKIGNIFLAVLEKLTGNFSRGLAVLSWILKIKGKIIPITRDNAVLEISFLNGTNIVGESNIDKANFLIEAGNLHYQHEVKINPEARGVLVEADYIIIGPGNLFCSILPNLIVDGFQEAITESKAKIIFIMNLVNKQGHTVNWSKMKYVEYIEKYLGKPVDVILDNNEEFTKEQKEHYQKDGGKGIFMNDILKDPRVIATPLLSDTLLTQDETDTVKRSLIRHDSKKLRDALKKII